MKKFLAGTALIASAMASTMASAGVVVESIGLGSVAIDWTITNTGPTDITSITFNLNGTTSTEATPLVFGGLNSSSGPAGGTGTLFTADPSGGGFSTFGFNFTDFNPGETFTFEWDPDTAANSGYGSTVIDGVGTTFAFTDTGAGGSGVMMLDQPNDRITSAAAVPEPGTLALLAGVVCTAGLWTRRRA